MKQARSHATSVASKSAAEDVFGTGNVKSIPTEGTSAQKMIDNSPRQSVQERYFAQLQTAGMRTDAMMPVQRENGEEEKPVEGKFDVLQRTEDEKLLQGKFGTIQRLEDHEDTLQGRFTVDASAQLEAETASRPNNTELPDRLKNGVESFSGVSLDDVKVHYNSDKPAQFNAPAYNQGTGIHVAPTHEKHPPFYPFGLGSSVQCKSVIQEVKYLTIKPSTKSTKLEIFGGIVYSPYEVQTDAGKWIEVFKGEHRYHEEMEQGKQQLLDMQEDNELFNCHGFTFGGSVAAGGPFSFLDAAPVNRILTDEYTAAPPQVGGTVVFGDAGHSRIIVSIEAGKGPQKDRIMVRSKLGSKSFSTESVTALERFGKAKFYITNAQRDRQILENEIEEIGTNILEQLALRGEKLREAQRLLAEIDELSTRPVPSTLSIVLSSFGLSNDVVVYQENLNRLYLLSQELQMVMQEIRNVTAIIKELSAVFSEKMDQL